MHADYSVIQTDVKWVQCMS